MLEEIVSKKPIATIGSYSHGIKFRNMIIASDQIPVDLYHKECIHCRLKKKAV